MASGWRITRISAPALSSVAAVIASMSMPRFARIAHKLAGLLLCLLGLPDFLRQIAEKRALQLFIILRDGRLTDALHDRIGIFNAIAKPAGGWVDDDFFNGNADIGKQNIELFGQIDINGRIGDKRQIIGKGLRAELLMICFINGADNELFVPGRLQQQP